MRRARGVAAVAKKKDVEKFYNKKSNEIDKDAIKQLQDQLGAFKEKLQWFATKHQHELQTDPLFRNEFIQMCASIGVDPLASSKGYWTEYLGVGTYYYMLAVQTIEIILAGAARHGGVMKMRDLWKQLEKNRPPFLKDSSISFEDITQALSLMEVVGKGCGIIKTSAQIDQALVFCVPEEMAHDQTSVLKVVGESGKACFVLDEVAKALGWKPLRAKTSIDQLIADGIVWVEIGQKDSPNVYWLPGLYFNHGD